MKKMSIIIIIIVILAIIGVIAYHYQEELKIWFQELTLPREKIEFEQIEDIKVTYYYNDSLENQTTTLKTIEDNLTKEEKESFIQSMKSWRFVNYNKKYNENDFANYNYEVTLNNDMKFYFYYDSNSTNYYIDETFVKFYYNDEDYFFTRVPTEDLAVLDTHIFILLHLKQKDL